MRKRRQSAERALLEEFRSKRAEKRVGASEREAPSRVSSGTGGGVFDFTESEPAEKGTWRVSER